MITSQEELAAALLLGGDVVCDPTVPIDLTDTMVVGLPTRLLGGAFTVESGPAFQVLSSDVEIAGLSITGPGGSVLDTGQKLIYALGTPTAPLTRVDVHDCRLSGSMSDSVWLEWCVDSSVHDCVISNFLDSGVMVISGLRVSVADNAISDGHVATGAVDVYGIAITDLLNTVSARSSHCVVTGNRVHEIDWEGIDTHGGDGLVVVGNTVTACRRGIALVTGNPDRVAAPTNCVASGNLVDGTGARVTADIGMFLAGKSGVPASATIAGNTITGYDGTGVSPITTMSWDRTNTIISGNSRPHLPATAVNLGAYTPDPAFPPRYTVDGNAVTLSGFVAPPAGGIKANPVVGTLTDPSAWPAERRFYAVTKGSNAAAGTGVLNVGTDGTLRLDYGNTADGFWYPISGTFQAI